MTISELAKELGVTRQAVDYVIRRDGITPKVNRKAGFEWRSLTAGQVKAIRLALRRTVIRRLKARENGDAR